MHRRHLSARSSRAHSVGRHTGRTTLGPSSISVIRSYPPAAVPMRCRRRSVARHRCVITWIPLACNPFNASSRSRAFWKTPPDRATVCDVSPFSYGQLDDQVGDRPMEPRPDHARAAPLHADRSTTACEHRGRVDQRRLVRAVDTERVSTVRRSRRHGTGLPARSPPAPRRPPPVARRRAPRPRRTAGPCWTSAHSRSRFRAGAQGPFVHRVGTRPPAARSGSHAIPAAHRCASAIRYGRSTLTSPPASGTYLSCARRWKPL